MTRTLVSRPRARYNRNALSQQLAELLSNREIGLISEREFQTALDVLQLGLPTGYIIKVVPLRGGGTGFLVHDMNALQEVDRFDFPRALSGRL